MHFIEPVIFEIPVYPRTQKYIHTKLVDERGQRRPLLASPYSQGISLHLWLTCQSRKVRMVTGYQRNGQRRPMLIDKSGRIIAPLGMTATLGLGISHFHKSRHQYLLNYQELEQLGSYVDFLILNELVYYCQTSPQTPPLVRIKEFTNRYDFNEDDFNEETLRVAYWRYRQHPEAYPFRAEVDTVNHFEQTYESLLV